MSEEIREISGNDYEAIYQHTEQQESREQRICAFQRLALPSFLYTLVYTFCMFRNDRGITMPIWVAATLGYVYYLVCIQAFGQSEEEGGGKRNFTVKDRLLAAAMLLLGISTFLTDNSWIVFFNYAAFFSLLLLFLLQLFYRTFPWDFASVVSGMLQAFFGAIGCLGMPFTDGYEYARRNRAERNETAHAVLIGVLCAVPVLLVVGGCLVSADAVFEHLTRQALQDLSDIFDASWEVVRLLAMLGFGFLASYCGMRYLGRTPELWRREETKQYGPVVMITITGMLTVLYLFFCGIQIVYLFAGQGRLPAGVSYAQYARSGFFQLLFVCILNFILVLLVKKYVRQSRILDIELLLICGCTFVMIASSCYRMLMYIDSYQLTVLRVTVLWALGVLALLMAGTVGMILRPQFPLFRYSFGIVLCAYLLLSFGHMDYFIANYNLTHALDRTDWEYLGGLSADAAPAIEDYVTTGADAGDREIYAKIRAEVDEGSYEWEYGSYDWYAAYRYQILEETKGMKLRSLNFSRFLAR